MTTAAFGDEMYVQFLQKDSVVTKDGFVIPIQPMDCFPVVEWKAFTVVVSVDGMKSECNSDKVRVVIADLNAKSFEKLAVERIQTQNAQMVEDKRMAAVKAQQAKQAQQVAASHYNDGLLESNRQAQANREQQGRDGAAWLQKQQMQQQLNDLILQQRMQQMNRQLSGH